MNYKLIACDLDGTLLNDKSEISEINLNAIKQLTGKGILFVPVTGRTLYEIPKKILQCESIKYYIYSDGAAAFSKSKLRNIFENYIDKTTAVKIAELLNKYDTLIEIYSDRHPFTEKRKLNEESFEYYNIDKNYRYVINETRIGVDNLIKLINDNSDIEMFNVFFKNQNDRELCSEILSKNKNIIVTTSMSNNIEIMSAKAGKGNTLKSLCEQLGLSATETVSVGDSKNDLSMLEFSATSLVTSNAQRYIQEKADNVICNNNENVAEYILKNFIEV